MIQGFGRAALAHVQRAKNSEREIGIRLARQCQLRARDGFAATAHDAEQIGQPGVSGGR
jgi:hypothetical protein